MAVINIKDSESFLRYKDLLEETSDPTLCSTISISSSQKPYGIYHDSFGWVKDITIITSSKEINVTYTRDKGNALSIVGALLKGRILLYGSCILL